jgi:hypothetical protein
LDKFSVEEKLVLLAVKEKLTSRTRAGGKVHSSYTLAGWIPSARQHTTLQLLAAVVLIEHCSLLAATVITRVEDHRQYRA